MNQKIVSRVLNALIEEGISHFCLCAAGRSAPFVYNLAQRPKTVVYHWPEERSAAFFALGKIKATARPVVVITTSGTAAAELLPAAMEAYYNGLPLILLTTDRPRHFRGSGAPQSAEQVGLFGHYTKTAFDLEGEDSFSLERWDRKGPLHLNICLNEPSEAMSSHLFLNDAALQPKIWKRPSLPLSNGETFSQFLSESNYPFVIVGALQEEEREAAVAFLLDLEAPLHLEAPSGLREDARLQTFAIRLAENIWEESTVCGYPIDGILRLGSVPTHRLWRDLEEHKKEVAVCSMSSLPFPGLSRSGVDYCSLEAFFHSAKKRLVKKKYPAKKWIEANQRSSAALFDLFEEEPQAEPSLVHALSLLIPIGSHVYLGNSMPIREWDLAATYEKKHFSIEVNRGVNGIDGQISTFFGSSLPDRQNWALIGDLTAIYDLAAPWILSQMETTQINLVIINNQGAAIFRKMYAHPHFHHQHTLSFKAIAEFWQMEYEAWRRVPAKDSSSLVSSSKRLIELLPDLEATERFWKKLKGI